jgi:Leucine-rich repeat (LRR) protein
VGLKSLKSLNLERNNMTRIDEAIGVCGDLEELNLDSNDKIVSLPDTFGNLYKLPALKLEGCRTLSTCQMLSKA